MERIKLILPETFAFSTTLQIRITDINYGGHVGNDTFLALVHEARQQYLTHYGYSELIIENVSLIMADSAIEYRQELSYGDKVKISVQATGFDRLGFDIFYLIELIKDDKLIIAGKVKTGMISFDYNVKKKVPLPQKAIDTLTAV